MFEEKRDESRRDDEFQVPVEDDDYDEDQRVGVSIPEMGYRVHEHVHGFFPVQLDDPKTQGTVPVYQLMNDSLNFRFRHQQALLITILVTVKLMQFLENSKMKKWFDGKREPSRNPVPGRVEEGGVSLERDDGLIPLQFFLE